MKEPIVLGIAVMSIGLLCGVAAWFGYGARPQAVGLYACEAKRLERCTLLGWRNSLVECRAARSRHSSTPADVLICIRQSDLLE